MQRCPDSSGLLVRLMGMRIQSPLALALAVGLSFLPACRNKAEQSVASAPPPSVAADMAPAAEPMAAATPASATGVASKPRVAALENRLLIRQGTLSLTVEDLGQARTRLDAILEAAGGFIAEARIDHDSGYASSAHLVVRVPANKTDGLIADLSRLGKVRAETLTATDVTDVHQDLRARLANARKIEERLGQLAATETNNVSQLLEVERELGRVREQIEQMASQLATLDDQVALSSITLDLYAREPALAAVPPPAFGDRAGSALGESWGALVETGHALALLVIALLPWSPLLALLVWFVIRSYRKGRKAPPSEATTA
jgi:Ca-activated chloride channel family protein